MVWKPISHICNEMPTSLLCPNCSFVDVLLFVKSARTVPCQWSFPECILPSSCTNVGYHVKLGIIIVISHHIHDITNLKYKIN